MKNKNHVACREMDGIGEQEAKQKRPDSERRMSHVFSHIGFWRGKKAINVEETNKEDKGSEGMGRVMDKRE